MKNIFFKKYHTPKRTYFFNVVENDSAERAIHIIESKAVKGGRYQRSRLTIHQDDSKDFQALLEETINFLNKNE